MNSPENITKLAVLEHRVNELSQKINDIDNKLDELLQLRSKGMGAFWLASILVGTSFVGFVMTMVSWMRNV